MRVEGRFQCQPSLSFFCLLQAAGFIFLGLNDLDTRRFGKRSVGRGDSLIPRINFLRLAARTVSLY